MSIGDTNVSHPVIIYDAEEVFGSCTLTGIENLLTPCVSKKSIYCTAKCLNAVLNEQVRQTESGEHDPDKLADITTSVIVG